MIPPHPRFSDDEMGGRRKVLLDAADAAGARALVCYGDFRHGTAVQWLSGWPVTREAALVITPDGRDDVLLIQHHNHLPQARDMAPTCDVRWGGASTADALVAELKARGLGGADVGWVGRLSATHAEILGNHGVGVVDLTSAYAHARLVKSDEEVAWLRRGAEMSDAGMRALVAEARPGMTEWALGDLVERAYVPHGGATVIHHLCTTSMTRPDTPVPRQHATARQVGDGHAVTAEISAAWWGYPGQVLRTIAIGAAPTPLYAELHAVADAVFDAVTGVLRPGATAAEVVEASTIIEQAGFTIVDDLVHGFGGGYLPPVLGSRSRPAGEVPDFTFEVGMTVVVQPNVVTPDWQAGVQTGELVVIGPNGATSLHDVPRGLLQVG